MKRMQLFGAVLVAVLAMTALVSATASAALPEFSPAKGVTLKGTSGKGTLETKSGTKVTCESGTDSSEVTAEKTVSKVKVTFKGCASSGFKCKTKGAAEGELVTNTLAGTLGYLSKAEKTVALRLKPAEGTVFIEFECLGGIVKNSVSGAVFGKLTPVNTKTKTFTLTFKQKAGVQEFTKFEGGAEEFLKTSINGGAAEQSAEEATATETASVEAEVKA